MIRSCRGLGLNVALLVLFVLLGAACSKPQPPQLTPRSVRVSAITPTELRLAIELEVYNPNSFPLWIRTARANLEVANGIQIGSGQATVNGTVPANASSTIGADLGVNWTNLPALAPLALTAATVPYTLRGSAEVGGERLNVELPFTLSGELTRAQLVQAGLRGLSAIPGFEGAPAAPAP